jgi:hypothetical protein
MRDNNNNYRVNRYPNGFAEKIGYWSYKMNKAIENLDQAGIEFAAQKLDYFVGRQIAISKSK